MQNRDSILLHSRNLEEFFNRNSPFDAGGRIRLPTVVLDRLSEWTTSDLPRILSIAAFTDDLNYLGHSTSTLIAAQYLSSASAARVPTISHFCDLPREEEIRSKHTPEAQALIALAYSLIRQVIESLDFQFTSEIDFEAARFTALDGTLGTWCQAMELLDDLLHCMSTVVFVVVDGLQWLDDASTDRNLALLIDVLRGQMPGSKWELTNKKRAQNRIKILLTTTGASMVLNEALSCEELVIMDQLGRRRRHGSGLMDSEGFDFLLGD